ncbi:mCpol domain-containing protein [Klebsiella quasipneumoniae]|nr:mCpol domain-containing protein [Klebsiella quasipneumoniae]HAV1651819.1 mCpol domain-containing protein [Enterobacter hormaechei subsp. xiangfangensis]HAV1653818.1 mCpol domain-containing protein [Enterobacter hormaechei subsp. xiangfangensis]HDE2509503.1 mCpol domain-containing protein [Klebsiella pneumoniae]
MYVTIDGDDVGQKISASYLFNNVDELININDLVNFATLEISRILAGYGFEIIFRAADGVAGMIDNDSIDLSAIFNNIQTISCDDITFSMGSGRTLKDSYVALITAKSNGKNQHYSLVAGGENV